MVEDTSKRRVELLKSENVRKSKQVNTKKTPTDFISKKVALVYCGAR